MLLLEPALGTTEATYQPWREPDFYMGFESHHGSPNPAETVKLPQTGSQGAFSIAGMDLFASLDMDALLGSAAMAVAQPQAPGASEPSDILNGHGQRSFHASYALLHPVSAAIPHQPHPQAPHISAIMPQALPAQMQQAPAAQPLLAHPQVAPINLLIAQTPAISIARAGQSCSAPAGQLSLGQAPSWTSISAPVGVCENRLLSAQALLPPAQSGGSEASARSHPPVPRRSIKATEPKAREHKEAAVRARNARNQHLHRQRQKDRIGKLEDLSAVLRSKIKGLTVLNAGLRAHNEALLDAESGTGAPDQGHVRGVWDVSRPEICPLHAAMHAKLAPVFSCISTGYGRQPVSTDDVARMSAEEIFSFRQQYGNRLRQLLQAGAESASCASHQELLRLVSLCNEAEEFLWEHCPRTVHRFAAFAQRLDDQQGVIAALKWRKIAVCLQLDERQMDALKAIHMRLTDQLLNVASERLHISTLLQGTLPEGSNTWEASRTFLSVRAGQRKLAASVGREHGAMRQAHASFRQIVTPVQQARLDVLAHPGHFDVIALLHELFTRSERNHGSIPLPS